MCALDRRPTLAGSRQPGHWVRDCPVGLGSRDWDRVGCRYRGGRGLRPVRFDDRYDLSGVGRPGLFRARAGRGEVRAHCVDVPLEEPGPLTKRAGHAETVRKTRDGRVVTLWGNAGRARVVTNNLHAPSEISSRRRPRSLCAGKRCHAVLGGARHGRSDILSGRHGR